MVTTIAVVAFLASAVFLVRRYGLVDTNTKVDPKADNRSNIGVPPLLAKDPVKDPVPNDSKADKLVLPEDAQKRTHSAGLVIKFGEGRHKFDTLIHVVRDTSFPNESLELLKAIMTVESGKTRPGVIVGYDERALNIETNVIRERKDGTKYRGDDVSAGLMQVRTDTARWIRDWRQKTDEWIIEKLFDPEEAIFTAFKYLRWQRVRYNFGSKRDVKMSPGIVAQLAASYNAGSIRLDDDGAFTNQEYVDKVLGWYNIVIDDFPKDPVFMDGVKRLKT